MCHVIRRTVALPVEGIGQSDVLDVLGQIRFYIKINRHLPAFIGFQELLGKTETLGFYKIQGGFGRGDVIGRLAGN